MKARLFAVATLICLVANLALAAQRPRTKARNIASKARGARLVPMLPASDGIVTLDARRLATDGLPRIFEANSVLLGQVNDAIQRIQTKTGIDLRKFDEVAIGLRMTPSRAKGIRTDGVALVSGENINAAALIAVAKLAANGAYRQENVAGHAVYIFTVKDVASKTGGINGKATALIDEAVHQMSTAIAVAAYDSNLLVIGDFDLVRQTLNGNTHPSAELTSLLNRNPSAIMNFATKMPAGLDGVLPLGNDELGKNLRSIQYLSGAMDFTAAGASLTVAARTAQPDQAEGLKATLDGLQLMGTALLGGNSKPANQVYGRMIKSAKFGQTGNEVTLDLLVPQADIDTLVSGIK